MAKDLHIEFQIVDYSIQQCSRGSQAYLDIWLALHLTNIRRTS